VSKPVITAKERSIIPEPQAGTDLFELPGYSDKRRARELAIRDGKAAPALDYRLQLVVTQDLAGKPDKRQSRLEAANGGVPLTAEAAKSLGIDLANSAYEVRADGTVGLNEYTVFVRTKEAAAKVLSRKEARDEAMQGTYEAKVADAVDAFNREAGLSGRAASQPLFEVAEK
jgi:hypothetical protein